jgi:hypothetical protein
MWIVKSFLLGLLSVIAGTIILVIFVGAFLSRMAHGQPVGWDPVSLVHQQPLVWVSIALLFGAGFYVGYRRHQRHVATQSRP